MQVLVFICFIQSILICNEINYSNSKALIGESVSEAGVMELANVVAILKYHRFNTQSERYMICTGTLITRDHVLTAEHCLFGLENTYVVFIIGSFDIRDGLQRFTMWYMTYNQWAAHFNHEIHMHENDIAVIRVTRNAPRFIVPAPLSTLSIPEMVDLQVTVAGWGLIANRTHPRYLKKATLNVISYTMCNEIASGIAQTNIVVPVQYFCTKANPYILLELGDSGGPAFDNNGTLLGINSGNCPDFDRDFHPETMNIHLAVAYYRPYLSFCMVE